MYGGGVLPELPRFMISSKVFALLTSLSDGIVYSALCVLLSVVVGGWYLFLHRPCVQEVSSLIHQNFLVSKRLESLKKRTQRLVSCSATYDEMTVAIKSLSQKFPETFQEAVHESLNAVKKSRLYLVSWNPQAEKEKEYYGACLVTCCMQGTYNQFIEFLTSIENKAIVSCCTLAKRVRDIKINLTLKLFFRKAA